MDIKTLSLETPTPVRVWLLPRRFDAVTWFVRLQRENPSSLDNVRVSIPQMGPSTLELLEGTPLVQKQLGFTGEILLASGIFPWHGHSAYLENLGDWTSRHSLDWPATAAITWVLCLHREAWLAVARTWLPANDTAWTVKSAWLTLALASADLELLALIPDQAYETLHAQVYADESARALRWLEHSHPNYLHPWLDALSKRSFFKAIWSRLSMEQRLALATQFKTLNLE